MSNTKIKFILVVDSLNSALRENEIRTMFRAIHSEYVNFISNPFVVPNEPIYSKYACLKLSNYFCTSYYIYSFPFHRTFDRNIKSKLMLQQSSI